MPTKLKLRDLQKLLSAAMGQRVRLNIWHYPAWYAYRRKDTLVLVMPMGFARIKTKHELLFMIVRGLEKAVAV